MKIDNAFVVYITEDEIKESFDILQDFNHHEALDIIFSEIARYIQAEDFVFSYYTEGKIFKGLPKEGSVAYFMIKEKTQKLEPLVQIQSLKQIMQRFIDVVRMSENKNFKIKDFENELRIITKKHIIEKSLEEKNYQTKEIKI